MTTNQPQVWLITGASSGSAERSPRRPWPQVIPSSPPPAGSNALAALAPPPDRVVALRLDVTDAARITDVVAEVLDVQAGSTCWSTTRGRGAIGAAEETTDGELRDLMELHFFGPAALTRAVLPHMRDAGRARSSR